MKKQKTAQKNKNLKNNQNNQKNKKNKLHKADLVCPKCFKKWAILTFDFNSVVTKENFEILINNYSLTNEKEELRCTNCGHIYKDIQLFLNILQSNAI